VVVEAAVAEVDLKGELMRYYCTLLVRSNAVQTASNIFQPAAIDMLGFDDMRSEANLARAERSRSSKSPVRFVVRNDLPRYCWSLTSLKAIEASEPDPYTHIAWLLSQLKPGVSLVDAQEKGIECTLSFYWGGQGTGGGPTVAPKLSELLSQHGINLKIGFYFEAD